MVALTARVYKQPIPPSSVVFFSPSSFSLSLLSSDPLGSSFLYRVSMYTVTAFLHRFISSCLPFLFPRYGVIPAMHRHVASRIAVKEMASASRFEPASRQMRPVSRLSSFRVSDLRTRSTRLGPSLSPPPAPRAARFVVRDVQPVRTSPLFDSSRSSSLAAERQARRQAFTERAQSLRDKLNALRASLSAPGPAATAAQAQPLPRSILKPTASLGRTRQERTKQDAGRKAQSASRVHFGGVAVTVVGRWIDPEVHCHPNPYRPRQRGGVQGPVDDVPEEAAADSDEEEEEEEVEDIWLSLAKESSRGRQIRKW